MIEFISKIFIFAVTYYYVLNYLFLCEVNTHFGNAIILLLIIIITLYHFLIRQKGAIVCNSCKRYI